MRAASGAKLVFHAPAFAHDEGAITGGRQRARVQRQRDERGQQAEPQAPLNAANGVDPKQPERVLGLPEPRILAALKKAWRSDRKPANVLLVLDTPPSDPEAADITFATDDLGWYARIVNGQRGFRLTIGGGTSEGPIMA